MIMCCWNFGSLLKGIPEQVMLAAVEHGTFCGLYLQFFCKIISPPDGDY